MEWNLALNTGQPQAAFMFRAVLPGPHDTGEFFTIPVSTIDYHFRDDQLIGLRLLVRQEEASKYEPSKSSDDDLYSFTWIVTRQLFKTTMFTKCT